MWVEVRSSTGIGEIGIEDAVVAGSDVMERKIKTQTTKDLIAEMLAVARDEIASPFDAAAPRIELAAALIPTLTPDNLSLLRTIRDKKPQSPAALPRLTNRAKPNLLRTLKKLEAFGLLEMRTVDRQRVPTATARVMRLHIAPYAMADGIEPAPIHA